MKLIIFDMDGTLVDTGNVLANTINHVRVQFDLPPMHKKDILHNINDPHINAAQHFYGTDSYSQEHIEIFTQYYETHCISDVVLYEGIKELLQSIPNEYTLSVATNASSKFAHKILDHVGIKHHFDLIVGADMVKESKPHPEMIDYTLCYFQKNRQDALLIGDSHKDILAAQNAQIQSILVNWGFTDHADGAICEIDELYNLLDVHKV